MLVLVTAVQALLVSRIHTWRTDPVSERGQATAEYALVLLAAAAIALVLIAWATKSGRIGRLFDAVFDSLIDKV
ncbi:MAG: DUF4244 domain-containing protein [Acidimicrobiales bacterium]